MRLSARVDYALRAVVELAAAGGVLATGSTDRGVGLTAATAADRSVATGERYITADELAAAQGISTKFLESILLQLRRGGIVMAQRGPAGGYRLARPASEISLADVIRVIDGPLAHVRGQRPENLGYTGAARSLQQVWIALRANERQILESVTVADVAGGELPDRVRELAGDPAAWA